MPEHVLIGWLVIARHQFSHETTCLMPRSVSNALIDRGWMVACDRSDDCDSWNAHLTSAGITVTDLNAPEWGINPIPETSHT